VASGGARRLVPPQKDCETYRVHTALGARLPWIKASQNPQQALPLLISTTLARMRCVKLLWWKGSMIACMPPSTRFIPMPSP
jgi:hypothetical protein